MMHEDSPRPPKPESVDALVDLLLSDLTSGHRETLAALNEAEFERFHCAVASAVLEEFDLWTGNEKLLASCMAGAGQDGGQFEPARIVLKKRRGRLTAAAGVVIVTGSVHGRRGAGGGVVFRHFS